MKRGFTLMELMVVIAILGLLIIVGISSYKSTQMKSRDNRRKSDLAATARALDLYLLDNGEYPPAQNNQIKSCGTLVAPLECNWGEEFNNGAKDKSQTKYMLKLPRDLVSGYTYIYKRPSTTSFQLYARLENSQDSDYSSTIVDKNINCGSGVCSYGISSSNTTP